MLRCRLRRLCLCSRCLEVVGYAASVSGTLDPLSSADLCWRVERRNPF